MRERLIIQGVVRGALFVLGRVGEEEAASTGEGSLPVGHERVAPNIVGQRACLVVVIISGCAPHHTEAIRSCLPR